MKYLEHNGHSNKKRYKLCMLLIMCITMTYIAAGCGSKRDGLTITNVSYDPTREFYEEYNKVFADYYMAEYGKQIKVIQSHGGSGSQARSVVEGCNADVVTLALEHDISLIENTGLIDAGWKDEYDKDSSPYTSTIVFLVRKGNPLNISDWDDLIKDGVEVITPDPKSSGGACWNFLAALSYARDKNNSEDKQKEFLGKLYANVSVLDSGARGSTTTFVENKKGDVLIAYGTVRENIEGRGPCYLRTEGISSEQDESLKKAYLNMAPSQTLKWIESGKNPSEQNVEIEGTEPYIVGGHTASGYWVDTNRRTTINGLYAAGDVAGGCPQKYVTGAMAEGEIAAEDIVKELNRSDITENAFSQSTADEYADKLTDERIKEYNEYLRREDKDTIFSTEELEEAMQKVMDTYAGGIGSHYQFNEKQLKLAKEKIEQIETLSEKANAKDYHELMFVYELKERLTVCQVLIEHLKARKETGWHSFAENLDYPEKSDEWLKYVNTRKVDGRIEVKYRNLVGRGETYEHSN